MRVAEWGTQVTLFESGVRRNADVGCGNTSEKFIPNGCGLMTITKNVGVVYRSTLGPQWNLFFATEAPPSLR